MFECYCEGNICYSLLVISVDCLHFCIMQSALCKYFCALLKRALSFLLCFERQLKTSPRGSGLFTADQQLKGDLPIYTRQNPAGTRRGLEVPEERDYYPYWGPSPWKDIAIMVSDKKTEDLMKKHVDSPRYGHKCRCSFCQCCLIQFARCRSYFFYGHIYVCD